MPALLAPQPVRPPPQHLAPAVRVPLLPPSSALRHVLIPSRSQPIHRLMSPIALAQRSSPKPVRTDIDFSRFPHPKRPVFTQTCTPSRRRPSGTPRRRRPLPRPDRAIHAFDQLPWITELEAPPQLSNPWDIADLSLLPEPQPTSEPLGPGPVRRRKTSLRSNPMASTDPESSPPSSPMDCAPATPPSPPPLPQATPLSRFSPSRILFRNLMPVSCEDGSPHHCINIRPLDF